MNIIILKQVDYFYFLYGLSFVFLALICLTLEKRKTRKLPWIFAGLFSALIGINRLLYIVSLNFGDNDIFKIFRLIILFVSLIFLFEFGRKGFFIIFNKKISLWVYLPIIILSISGISKNLTWLNATISYFSGIPAGVLTAIVIYYSHRFTIIPYRSTLWLSIIILIFTITANLIIPASQLIEFEPISKEVMSGKFELTVLLFKGLFVIIIVSLLYNFLSKFIKKEKKYFEEFAYLPIFKWTVIFFIFVILSGWVLTEYIGYQAEKKIIENSRFEIYNLSHRLTDELNLFDGGVISMSGSPWIVSAMATQNKDDIEKANSVLDRYKNALRLSVCYLLDKNGTTIASSNRDDKDSFVGKNYSFRPYFKEAILGKLGHYFALGVTSKKRGYYASFPVKDKNGKVLGISVIKKNIDYFEKDFKFNKYLFFVDPNGIIFLAGKKDILFKSLWPVSDEVQKKLLDSKQFGRKPFQAVLKKELFDKTEIIFENKIFIVNRKVIGKKKWSVVLLSDTGLIKEYRLFSIFSLSLIILLTIIFNFIIELRRTREWVEKIAFSEERFRMMFENAPEAIFIYEKLSERILEVNPFMIKWLGYSEPELHQFSLENLIDSESIISNEGVKSEFQNELISLKSCCYIKKDKKRVNVEISRAEIKYKEKDCYLYSVRDVTGRIKNLRELKRMNEELIKANNELKTLDEMKNNFLSNVSHELRTPLVSVRGYSELIISGKSGPVTDKQKKQLNISINNIDRLVTLIDSLLSFAKFELGKEKLINISVFDIRYVVSESISVVKIKAIDKKLPIINNMPTEPVLVNADRKKILQVFTNLLDNALKFTTTGGQIILNMETKEDEIIINITDTGIGISKDEIDKIFDRFYQVESSITRRFRGTGIGLSLSQEIIKLHGGEIKVKSKYGKGSTFIIKLPLYKGDKKIKK